MTIFPAKVHRNSWQYKNPKRVTRLVIISSTYKSSGWMPEITNAFKKMKPELFANSPLHAAYNAVTERTSE